MNRSYSVLMSIYFGTSLKDLKESLGDILEQKENPSKIILVSDGEIKPDVEKYINSLDNNLILNVKYPKNKGLGYALFFGQKFVDTKYLMRMDSDDRSSKNRANLLLDMLEKYDADICGSFAEHENKISKRKNIVKYETTLRELNLFNYFRDPLCHASCMIRTNSLFKAGGYKPLEQFEDTYLWLRMSKLNMKLINIPKILYFIKEDHNFYKRRKGFSYIKCELAAFLRFYKEGLISIWSLFINLFLRPIIRLSPTIFLLFFYQMFLREEVGSNFYE